MLKKKEKIKLLKYHEWSCSHNLGSKMREECYCVHWEKGEEDDLNAKGTYSAHVHF